MARRDYRHRETKKTKKAAKQVALPATTAPLNVETEVIRKRKPAREEAGQ